jgi:serine protease Do
VADFGLKERRGALVATVRRGMAAAKAGVQPGDIILEFNGRAVKNRDELVRTVVATKPGSTVPMKVLRDKKEMTLNITVEELNLEDENAQPTVRETDTTDQQENPGFGLTLGALTPEAIRALRLSRDLEGVLVTDVEPGSPADRARIAPRDVILEVNRRQVRTPQEAARALSQVPSGGTAFLLVLRGGQETFVTLRKQ